MYTRATDSLTHFPPSPTHNYQLTLSELDSLSQLNSEVSSNANYSGSSGSTSYVGSPSSLASHETQRVGLMQRSVSSHSLQKNSGVHHPFSALFAELMDSKNGPVRRVYSTGDLQSARGMSHYHHSDSPLSTESSMIIEEMTRAASPYSPEEKKLRIERYRSKRNQRNFTKKIKYACRKTLADSRPRVRGRFVRNDEIVMDTSVTTGEELEDDEDENWTNFFDSLVPENHAHDPQSSSSFDMFY
ncbi:zinc finger protein CO3 [Lotus japonicus]|uniref:zinc finger protein CO3 n=1 Tax=Lotus japonicus TaxID=34305 RepID=UPI0025873BE3|nr:zinc finger protein CO3 [Lotus japonicus]